MADEQTATKRAYPEYVSAALKSAGVAGLLGLLAFLMGTHHPWGVAAFVAATSMFFFFLDYRRIKTGRQDKKGPLFDSVGIEVLVMTIAMGLYGLAAQLFIIEEPRTVVRMTAFFALLGGISAYRRHRWPKSGLYDAFAAASALVISIPVGMLVERLRG